LLAGRRISRFQEHRRPHPAAQFLVAGPKGGAVACGRAVLARRDLTAKLEPTDREYVAGCQRAERSTQRRARRAKVLVGTRAACVIAVVGLSYAGILDQSYLNS
jgi:hypothetical protein